MNNFRVRMVFFLNLLVLAVLLQGHEAMAQGNQAAPLATTSEASAVAGRIHTAILEPQVTGKISTESRRAIVSMVDTFLLEQLSHGSQLVLVDRQLLDKVLAEYQLQLSQPDAENKAVQGIAADQLPAALRQFWTAGVLIFTTIQADSQKPQQYVVDIQAVSAQSGQLVGQVAWVGQLQAEIQEKYLEQKQPADLSLHQKLVRLAREIPLQASRQANRPMVEVTAGQLVSEMNRLQWLVDHLSQSLSLEVEVDGRVTLLQPRHPGSTYQERLLRVMGLAKAGENDLAAALRPVPDGRLNFTLEEQFSPDIPFDKTPLILTLHWQSNDKTVMQIVTGNIGEWQSMQQAASQWATVQRHKLPNSPTNSTDADDENIARSMASQELALMSQWASLSFSNQEQEILRRRRVIHHAFRAAHLDPTSEQAAFTAALYCDALYNQSQEHESHAGLDLQNQVIAECQRYLSRFANTADKDRISQVNSKMALAALYASRLAGPQRGLALSTRQNSEIYRYASLSVPIFMERDATAAATSQSSQTGIGNLWASSWLLRLDLIMNCPDDELDAQQAYWREFWRTKIEPLPGDAPPWALMEVFFQTRRGNWQQVRIAYETLAEHYALSVKRVWYYGQTLLPPQTLRVAGDPDWSMWMPTIGSEAIEHVSQIELDNHTNVSWAPNINMLPYGLILPSSKLMPALPDGTQVHQSLHALTDAGGDLWLVTPAVESANGGKHQLYITTLPPEMAEATLPIPRSNNRRQALPLPATVQPISWPLRHGQVVTPTILCVEKSTHQGRAAILLGTRAHGLAIFEQKQQGQWDGRWITTREGLPADQILSITPWQDQGRAVWLIRGVSTVTVTMPGNRTPSTPHFVWTLDPADNTSHILFQGSVQNLYKAAEAAVADPAMRALLASQMTSPQMRQLVNQLSPQASGKPFLAYHSRFAQAGGRLWEVHDSTFTARSLQTLEPIDKPIGNSLLWPRLPFEPRMNSDYVKNMFYPKPFRMQKYDETTLDWPAPNVRQLITWNDMLVMTIFIKNQRGNNDYFAIYQPAPQDSANWASQDKWSFFVIPERAKIKSLYVDTQQHLWISTDAGLFRMNQQQLMLSAELPRDISFNTGSFTSEVWREKTREIPLQNHWQRTVATLLLDKEYDRALALIEETRILEPDMNLQKTIHVAYQLSLEFMRARVLVEQGKIDEALATYEHILTMDICTPPVELNARLCQMIVLHRSHRWQELLALYEKTTSRFVQLADDSEFNDLEDMIKEARQAHGQAENDSPSKVVAHE